MSEKVPVADEAAERGAIGALILDADRLGSFARGVLKLRGDSFFNPRHGAVFDAVMDLLQAGQAADLLTVQAALRRKFGDDAAEFAQLCRECVDEAVSPAAGPGYLEIVRAGAVQRAVQMAAMEVSEDCYKPRNPEDVDAFASSCAARVAAAALPREQERSNADVLEVLCQKWQDAHDYSIGHDESKRPAIGLETPWGWLTSKLCGLEPGLTVVGGRPSAGKTTFEDCIVEHVCTVNPEAVVLRWTMDSTPDELLGRMVARRAGVSLPKLKSGFTRKDQLAAARVASAAVGRMRMKFHTGCDLHEGMAWIGAQCMRAPVALVTVDYVQQIQLTQERGFRADNENARLTIVSGALKALSLRLRMPFLVLSQLSRNIEHEGREETRLSDLRSSGAIEQDADKVLAVSIAGSKWKEMESLTPGCAVHKRPVKFEIIKHKNGETGWRAMWLYPAYFKFVPAADPVMKAVKDRKGNEVQRADCWPDDEPVVEGDDQGAAAGPRKAERGDRVAPPAPRPPVQGLLGEEGDGEEDEG